MSGNNVYNSKGFPILYLENNTAANLLLYPEGTLADEHREQKCDHNPNMKKKNRQMKRIYQHIMKK